MKQQKQFPLKKPFLKARNAFFFSYLFLVLAFFGTINISAQTLCTGTSLTQFPGNTSTTYLPCTTNQQLIVYNDVPNQGSDPDYKLKSNQYRIQARIKNLVPPAQWTEVFALKTYNKNVNANPALKEELCMNDQNPTASWENYLNFTGLWSHTYGNIEIDGNTPVEVKITKLNGSETTTPTAVQISYAAPHPSEKVTGFNTTFANGFAIFTIDKPCQITVDFGIPYVSSNTTSVDIHKGAMDGRNRGQDPWANDVSNPVHAVTLFANPIMTGKPAGINGSDVFYVTSGTVPSIIDNSAFGNGSKKTMYFLPGVHNLGINFKLYKGKQYYIPGDAIVYGTFNNLTETNAVADGTNIKVFGYGTISGGKQKHPRYIPCTTTGKANNEELYKAINISNASSGISKVVDGVEIFEANVEGITIADPANHAVSLDYDKTVFKSNSTRKPITFAKWIKIITWRGNGDGIGAVQDLSNSFFRTNDDSGYIRGNKSKCIFWKDCNAAVFHMAGIPDGVYFPLKIDDCEVIYARSREIDGPGSGIFHLRGNGSASQSNQLYAIDLTVDNFKVSDPLSNMPVFNIFNKVFENKAYSYGPMYSGMKFYNVTQVEQLGTYVSQNITVSTDNSISHPVPLLTSVCFNDCVFNGQPAKSSHFTGYVINNPTKTNSTRGVNLGFGTCLPVPTARISGAKSKESDDMTSGIKVYYNANILHVDFPNTDMSREIQLYNLLGQMVYKTTSQKTNTEIDARSLNLKGVVIVRVVAGDEVSSHKVMVQ